MLSRWRVACGTRAPVRPTVEVAPGTTSVAVAPASRRRPTSPLPSAPADDPVLTLIADLGAHFQDRPERARSRATSRRPRRNSTRPVDVLLDSPYGGRTEPRIREHFDRLVDRISTYEVRALAQGDGFTEKQYEPASIDELLAVSTTFEPAGGDGD